MVSWTLNAVGLFVTTTGVLLMFLYLANTAPRAVAAQPAANDVRIKNHRRLQLAIGLLALWLLIQDVAVIFL